MKDLIQRIRLLADELSSRGVQPGHVEAGTRRRAAEINQQLVVLFNTQLETIDSGQRLPTKEGVILKMMIQHVMAAGFGARTHSAEERESRIVAAAKALPDLCDKLCAGTVQNPWRAAREQNPKITISDQMMTLFTNDDSIVDRKSLSKEVARILGCSEQAVRHRDNKTWQFYKTEQARRKKIRQDLRGQRSFEPDHDGDAE